MSWYKPLLKKQQKYGAKRTRHAGYSFASKIEAQHFAELKLLQRTGEIKEIQCQAQVVLSEAAIIYKPDFKVTYADGHIEYHEVKGFETPEWRIKRRLWMAYGPGVLKVFKGQGGRISLHEELRGKSG